MFANMTTPTYERSYVSIPCSLPTNIHSLQQHLKRCCPRGCSLAIQHHDLWPQGGEENAKKYPRANCCSKIRLHYLTISDLLCICYQYHLIYIYNYYIIYIYIIYCNLLLISTPLRLVSKTAFTAAKCSPMLASLPAKWEPKCATCSPSWRCTCPRQLRTRSRKKSAGFQKWFPMSFEVLLALTSLFIIGLFSDVQLWFFMVFHHFSCLFSWWLWAILGTALPFRGRPRSSSTAKRPPGPRAQMRLSSVTLRPWSFLGRNYQKLGTDVRKKKGR